MSRLRFNILLLALLLSVAIVTPTWSQNAGVAQPEHSALELAYQAPEGWEGTKYAQERSFWERFYLSSRFGTEAIWDVDTHVSGKARGVKSSIAAGYNLGPIHSVEVGVNYGVVPYTNLDINRLGLEYTTSDYLKSFGLEARYLFNFTNYALKRQDSGAVDLMGVAGLGLRIQNGSFSVGLTTGLRVQYNVTSKLGLYVEPTISYFDNGFDGEEYNAFAGHFVTGVMGGISLRLNPEDGYNRVGTDKNMIHEGSLPGEQGNPMFAISTNTLMWAVAMPNIGFDVPIGRRFSVGFEYMSPYFDNRDAGYYYMAQLFDGDVRFWFNSKSKLQGFFVGFHATLGWFDIQLDESGVQGRSVAAMGIMGGYTQPLGRNVSLELGLGFGSVSAQYETYEPDWDCLVYERGGVFSMLGVTKASIGVVWTPVIKRRKK